MTLVELARLADAGPSVALYEALTPRRICALIDVARAAESIWLTWADDTEIELRAALDELDFALATPIEDVVVTTGVL